MNLKSVFVAIYIAMLSISAFAQVNYDTARKVYEAGKEVEAYQKSKMNGTYVDYSVTPTWVSVLWGGVGIAVVGFFVFIGVSSRGVFVDTSKPKMIPIPAGSFEMGSENIKNAKPTRTVSIKNFKVSSTPITQKQWSNVMNGRNPSCNKEGGDHPVNSVSWDDAQTFIQKLNASTGKKYRLLTESEWEYSARASSTGLWCFGDDESLLDEYSWYTKNYHYVAREVAKKKPNAFGLYDMHGLIQEWVQDSWHPNYKEAPSDGSEWTGGSKNEKVIRGGSGSSEAKLLYSAARNHTDKDMKASDIGFRIALDS